jgi:hypothetical protein
MVLLHIISNMVVLMLLDPNFLNYLYLMDHSVTLGGSNETWLPIF